MEAGKKEYEFQPTDLNTLVQGVLKNYQSHLEHEGFMVHVETDHRLPSVFLDSGAVSEAVLNIIDNAVKYGREGRYLRIASGFEEGRVFIDIEDHGIGINPQQQKRRGTGLGLALVKHIMDAHKGSITLRSEEGKGSTFRLTFPLHPIKRN
jgi:two-component system phosphate regulon sensor histidine kinase PhoR